MNGLILLDKPAGWTSHDAVARVRRLTGERRVGHAGTLDPLATGVLVLGVGQGTRVLAYLDGAGKTYQARVRLGVSTNTYDADGEVTAHRSIDGLTPETVEAALAEFRGDFEQRPPMFSALKRAGRPLYSYARAGIELDVPARRVRVDALTLRRFDPPDLDLEIDCSSGFYVRSLAHDLGGRLGCGAHLLALRRSRVGPFTIDRATTVEALEQAAAAGGLSMLLQPLDTALDHLPAVRLDAAQELAAVQGQEFSLPLDSQLAGLTLRQAQDERRGMPARGEPAFQAAHGEPVEPRAASGIPPEGLACRAYAPDGSLAAVLAVAADGTARPLRVFPRGRRGSIAPLEGPWMQ